MRLVGFKYFEVRRLLALVVLVALSSMLFSLTAFTLVGYYRGFYAYLGEGEDVVAIYDRRSRTPFTGIVPAYLAETVGGVDGVLAVSPEVIVPCVVRGQSTFLRGVVPESFLKLSQLTIARGGMLTMEDLNSAIVGERLAGKLNLNPGDRVLVMGVLVDRCFELMVKGVFRSGSPIDDEIVAPLYVGQWLRGSGYDYVTLIRVKVDGGQVRRASILEAIAKEASEPRSELGHRAPELGSEPGQRASGQPVVSWRRLRFQVGGIGVDEAQKIMESYLERYGVTRESLLVLSAMVFFLSSSAIVFATKIVIAQHRGELAVLRAIGSSKKLLKVDILMKLLLLAAAASLAGVIAASIVLDLIQGCGCLQVLSHAMLFQFDPLISCLNFILVSILVSVSVLCFRVEF